MRNLLIAAAVAFSLLLPRPALAQVSVSIHFDLPVVLPTLVVIEPGIQVVPDVNEEVFFVDGFYWVRRDTRWYRSPDHRKGWVVVEGRGVPGRLVKYPQGHYRQWNQQKERRGKEEGKHDQGHHEQGDHEKKEGGKDKGNKKD
jgi:hypothetical protein